MSRPSIRPLAKGWWWAQSHTYATNSGIVRHDEQLLLIDPGLEPPELAAIARFVAQMGAQVRYLVLTHAHWDHLLGAGTFPRATVVTHRRYPEVIAEHGGDLRRQVAHWAAQAGFSSLHFRPPRPVLAFGEKLTLHVGCHPLQLIATPGHSPDHLSLFAPATKLLWAGDMLSDCELPYVQDNAEAYLTSLEHLHSLEPTLLVPGHGEPTDDPTAIEARFQRDIHYLQRLITCVTTAVARGEGPEAARRRCNFPLPFNDAANRTAHRRNVETTYAQRARQLGFEGELPAGWEEEWHESPQNFA